eukprot:6708927-Prymnesium_polylepis.1
MLQCGVHGLASAVRMHLPSGGQLSAAQAGADWWTICSSCTRVAAVRPRRCTFLQLQLEHGQLSGNGLRRDLELSSAEVSTKADPDGRLVRRLQTRQTADLSLFARKPQISTYLGLDHVRRSPRLGTCCQVPGAQGSRELLVCNVNGQVNTRCSCSVVYSHTRPLRKQESEGLA